MKRLKRIVSIIIWGVIAFNLLTAGILSMSGVQQFAGRKIAHAISNKLGTKIDIGRVSLGLFNRVIIDDVCLYDQRHKEMLRVGRLSAKIDMLPLAEGKISISSAQLFGAHARLYRRNATTAPNFHFVIDSLASKDTTSHTPLDLRISTLIIRHSSVSYDQQDIPLSEQFTPAHLTVRDISAHINLRALTDDSLNINVKRLGFREDAGLAVDRLSFALKAGRRNALLSHFLLQMLRPKMFHAFAQEFPEGSIHHDRHQRHRPDDQRAATVGSHPRTGCRHQCQRVDQQLADTSLVASAGE